MCSNIQSLVILVLTFIGWPQLCYGAVPVFSIPAPDGSTTQSIDETAATGTTVLTVVASDTDGGNIAYSIVSQPVSNKFQLSGAALATNGALDFETEDSYTLEIQAVTDSMGGSTSTVTMIVNIADINDESPVITGTFTGSINEEVAVGTVAAGPFTVTDADAGDTFSYTLSGSSKFQIDSSTREVKTAEVIDFEDGTSSFTLTLTVSDSASTPHTDSEVITITLNNINDNTPTFSSTSYYASVVENSAADVSVVQLIATDGDASDTVTLAISSGADSKFRLDGQLIETDTNAIDYDSLGPTFLYTVVVTASDGTLTGTTTVYVSVTGQNEAAPVWGTFTPTYTDATTPFNIAENSPVGHTIVTIAATDTDAGTDGSILYTFGSITSSGGGTTSGLFHLDQVTGVLTTTSNSFDRDTATGGVEYYDIVVKAVDQGSPVMSVERTVRVGLTDFNDNTPTFSSNVYTHSIAETASTGSIFSLAVTDNDESSTLTYALQATSTPASYSTHFELDTTTTNQVNLKAAINLDPADGHDSSYSLVITVTDGGSPELTGTTTLVITVTSVNEATPTFSPTSSTITVSETAAVASVVTTFAATDTDEGSDGTITYSIKGGNTNNKFNIDSSSGVVSVASSLDFETAPQQYVLLIEAKDGGSSPLSSTGTLTVDLTDVSDEVPSCTTYAYAVSVTEPGTVGTPNIVTLACTDPDAVDTLTYSIASGNSAGKFSLSGAGAITLAGTLDYDSATQTYALLVQVTDGTTTLDVSVNVQVAPSNENTPAFGADLDVSFAENTAIGSTIATHVATDADFSPHDVTEYQISSVTNSGASLFSIDRTSGAIKLSQSFDYESITTKFYIITVFAIDGGSLTGTGSVTVTVTDINDVTPSCNPASHVISVPENTATNADIIADFSCSDTDGSALTYTIASQSPATDFAIDTTGTPKLILSNALDYETHSSYDISVTVSDGSLSTTINIDISITDVNDGGPSFSQASYTASVAENTAIGTSVIDVIATDPDSSTSTFGNLQYSFISGNGDSKFLINPSSGRVLTAGVLNAEPAVSYSLVVQAIEEAGTNSVTVTLSITVTSINDNAPTCSSGLTFSVSLAEEGTVGDTVHTLTCTDADGDLLTFTMTTGDTTYFVMSTNTLQLNAPIDFDTVTSNQFSIVIQVSDGSNTVDVSGSVIVTAVNEHTPAFASATVAVSKAEGTSPGSVITTTAATDNDKGDTITYSFVTATSDFTIDQSTGQILLGGSLDREAQDSYSLTVQGSDGTNSAQYTLTLTVTDINDNTPVFNPQTYSSTLLESVAIGTAVVTVTASDADDPGTNNYGTVQFSIINGNTGNEFTIGTTTGAITTTGSLDYETTTSYTLIVQAIDSNSGVGALSSTAVVTVTISPVNEDDPSFSNTVYTVTIAEDTSSGQSVTQVVATDNDDGNDGVITFSMMANTYFLLNTENGDISVQAALDYESATSHTFEVVATDAGTPAMSSTATVTILISDVNDNTPTCSPNVQTVSFAENTALNTNLATLTCSDTDSGVNSQLNYAIQSVTPTAAIFEVTTAGLVNLINTQFNFESVTSYSVKIEVSDTGTPALTTTATINVDVTDVNEASPAFTTTSFTFSLSETTASGTSVFAVAATDADTANTVFYSINPESPVFAIDLNTGIITTKATIDYDTLPAPKEYEFTVYATDNGAGSLSVTQTVTATVLDNNDGTPIFSPGVYAVSLAEDAAQGITITTVNATDIDDPTVTLSLANNFGILRIDPTGELILNTASQDFETTQSYTVVVYAVDGNSNTGTATVYIEVTGVNEHDPSLTPASAAINLAENSAIGTTIVTVAATDADLGVDGTITYSLSSIPAGYAGDFAIDPTSGAITVAGTLDMETVTNPLTIKALATDGGTVARSAEFTLTLTLTDENDNTPSCSPSLYSVSIAEDIGVSTSIAQLTCTDADIDSPNNELRYSIASGNTGNHFTLDLATGQVSTSGTAALDRETLDNYQLIIEVADNAVTSLTTTTTLTVTVTDVNDNSPAFGSASYTFTQAEDTAIGSTLGTVAASDNDIGSAGSFVYSIFSGDTDSNLAIDSNTGDIRLIATLDYENDDQYDLIIYAIDKLAPMRTGSTTVTVSITDVNDVTPTCSNALQSVTFPEDTTTTTVTIATVSCPDTDTGARGTVSYSISTVDGVATTTPFSIDSNSGVITLSTQLDYESDTLKQIVVSAIDGGTPALTGTATINVAVTDVNEAAPVFGSTPYTVSIVESTAIGQSVYKVTATDADTSNTITYSFSVASTVFEIDSATGEVFLRDNLDFETTPSYTLTVVATDDGTSPSVQSSTETLNITITGANDGVPVFNPAVYVASISENDNTGTTVTTVTATDSDGTTPTYSISTGNTGNVFRVEASGVVAIDSVASLDYDAGPQSYTLVIEATDGTNTGTTTVAIAVTNYNDNAPILTSTSSTQTLAEDSLVGSAVVSVAANDADSGTDGDITYSISSGNTAGKFAINPSTGAVTLVATLDMESVTSYTLNIDATDAGTNPGALSAQYVLTVTVTDVNDVTPVCTSSYYSVNLPENSAASTSVAQLTCSDGDVSSPNKDINQFFINSGNPGGDLTISNTGEVTVVNPPDRETTASYILVIHVIDNGGASALTATTTLAVIISDVNDNTPSFGSNPYGFNTDEDTSIGTVIGTVAATDTDSGSAGTVTYTVNNGNVDSKFELDSSTGELKLISSLDYETATNNPYVLEIFGTDNDGTTPLTATTTASITVNDKNDNSPSCTPTVQAVSFAENTAGSTTIATITCTDADSAPNGGLTNEIVTVNGAVSTLFDVSAAGVLTTAATTVFDFETTSSYAVLIRTKDSGTPSLSTTSTVNVVITDINEHPPVFQSTPYATNVPESTVVGTSVYVVTALDSDTANTVNYTISPSNAYFEIDAVTGIVYTKAAIDYDTLTPTNIISLTLVATDNGSPSQSVTETLTITVTDVNDRSPVFSPAFYAVSVAETQTVGTTVVTVTATDIDDPSLTYSIAAGNTGSVFRVDNTAGDIIIDDVTNFDYDSATQSYTLVIRAVDAAPNTASTTVVIEVTNINDNPPTFASSSSTQTIAENTATGTTVIDLAATDNDFGDDGVISYNIASVTNSGNGKFSVDPSTGVVTVVSGTIDRESVTDYVLNIEAVDGGTPAQTATYTLTVSISDENDITPNCSQTIYSASISENAMTTTSVSQITCTDGDATSPNNAITTYNFASGNTGMAFAVSATGEITVNAALDRETLDNYRLVIQVVDSGTAALTTSTTVTILVTDENDNTAVFVQDPYNFNQPESISIGTVVGTVVATDGDIGNNGMVIYSIVSGDADSKFQIDSSTGDITTLAELDFETATSNPYTLVINAVDGTGTPQTGTTSAIITISDTNDNTPVCTPVLQTVSSAEDTTTPTTLVTLNCNDADSGVNDDLTYNIASVNGVGSTTLFSIDTSGAIRLTNALNYESVILHAIIAEINDGGTPSLTTTVTVNVQVTDVNDNTPAFSGTPYSTNVIETTAVGTSVFTVTATDVDTADTITFSVNPVSPKFDVDPSTGNIFLKATVDFDTTPTQYEVIVVATDDGTNPGAKSASATVTIDITNFNDGTPEFNPGFYALSVRENTTTGTSVLTVTVTDIDTTTFTYNIDSGNGDNIFGITGTTTTPVLSVADATNLDFETTQAYTLVISVSDGSNTGTATIEIAITNYNEHTPSLAASTSTPSIAENSAVGTSVADVDATDADSGVDGDITYSIVSGSNGKYAIDPTTGLLTVSGSLDKETLDSYTVVIHAVDAGVYPGALTATYSAVVTITDVNDFAPVCSSSLYSSSIPEDSVIGTTVVQLTCQDADSNSPNNDVSTYSFTSGNAGGEFLISTTGEVTTTVTFNRESTASYELVILVTDSGTTPSALSTSTTLTVSITDVNDNNPVFSLTVYNINIDETTALHTSIGKVAATDIDIGLAGSVLFSIVNGNSAGKFALDKTTGDVTLVGELDYETTTTTPYVLTVHAIDREATFRTGTATVSITINDINDNEPTCTASLYTGTLAEDVTTSTSVATVVCSDVDTVGSPLAYSIISTSPEFTIATATSGEITTASSLDYETATSHDLTVQVTDGTFSVNVSVTVTVTNVNDETPAFTPGGPYTATIDENLSAGTTVFNVNATDADAAGTSFVFSITTGNTDSKFSIGTAGGEIQIQESIDRDDPLTTSYTLGIEVADKSGAGARTASTSIVITITDLNDNNPICNSSEYITTLSEDSTAANIITPSCSDLDVVASPTLLYAISSGNGEGKFQIGSTTGVLSRIVSLDYETTTSYTLTVTVNDQGTPALTTTVTMIVYVDPVNEDPPVFQSTPYDTAIDEDKTNGYVVLTVSATDTDTGSTHGTVRYSITNGNSAGHFSLNPSTGVLIVAAALDRESTSSYTLIVAAADMLSGDGSARTVTEVFTITINDVNDNYPQINPSSYTASLNEHVSGTLTTVLQITATDDDAGVAGTAGLVYSITAGNTLNVFQMNGNTLELNGNVDANTQSIYTLTVRVADQGTPVLSSFTTVSVQIVATNDHAPTFASSDGNVTISESETVGNSIYQVAGSDSDTGSFAILRYYLRGGVTAGSEEFTVDRFNGIVRVATQLDYDTAPQSYTLIVEVEDTENPETNTQTATRTLTVSLTDFNDETPTCTSNTFTGTIDENSGTGTSVLRVTATDNDSGSNGQITYSIVGGSGSSTFAIDPSVGDVTNSAALDYEVTTVYDLEIQVIDGGTPTLSSSCLVRITINDLNDNTPVLLSSNFALTFSENTPIATTLDTVQATDADSAANNNNVISFSLSAASAFFSVGPSTGALELIASLDRETLASHTVIILAADQGTLTQNTASTTYTIIVSDENDNVPTVTNAPYDTTVLEDTVINTVVHTLTVTDADEGENAVLTYTITNGNTNTDFRIDSGSGLIQIINTLDRERTSLYNLEVTVTDGGTPQQSVIVTATVSVGDINDNNPIFQPVPTTTYTFTVAENVPNGTVVDSVSALDADTGTNAAITYVVVSYVTGDGSHFSLNTATGEITTAGNLDRETQDTYVFIVRAMDGGTNTLTATATVSITINDTNDNIPSFGSTLYTATVVENTAVDTSILTVVFNDQDINVNDDIVLSIDTGTTEGARADTYIYTNSTTATLYVKLPMDRESDQIFNFTLVATDAGTPPLSFSTSVIITVGDANDNAPIFSPTFYNSEIAYNDGCQVTVTQITATDADSGVNAVIEYYTTLNNNPHLFSLNSTSGVVSLVAHAASDTGYVIYAAARDKGSPQQNSSTGATIRVDTYNPSNTVLNYYMNINRTSYLALESTFLSQLTTVYQATYPTSEAKRWCVHEISDSSCVVRIYVIKDDTADQESEITNPKQFLTADEAYAITAADEAGTPASVISGISWTQFAITRVEKYSDPVTDDSKPWVQTAAGIAVLSVVGVIGAILIGGLIAYGIYYWRKPDTPPPRNRVEVGDDDGGDTVAKNQFNSKNNTLMSFHRLGSPTYRNRPPSNISFAKSRPSALEPDAVSVNSKLFAWNLEKVPDKIDPVNDTTYLPHDKKNLPAPIVALPMPSATKRVPIQTGNKVVDRPKDVNLFNTHPKEPPFEKKPEKLRRGSLVPTETVYSPASRYRSESPFLQSEINYPVKRLPPTQRPPAQRPQRLEDSVSTEPDNKSTGFDSENYSSRFNQAVDPVTGRVYEFNIRTGERKWVTKPQGSLVKLTRNEF